MSNNNTAKASRERIQQILSAIMLIGSFYIILSKQYADSDTKWAYGMIGTILGFWLRR